MQAMFKNDKLNQKILQMTAEHLIKEHWDTEEVPTIVVDYHSDEEWEGSMGSNGFSPLAKYFFKKQYIEFNSKTNYNRTDNQIRRTLLHELCHWYLHINDKPYRDSDERFALELIRTGISGKHNHDAQSLKAIREAKKFKQKSYFEFYDVNSDQIIRIRHPRKNHSDFQKDLKEVYLDLYINCLNNVNEDGELTEEHDRMDIETVIDELVARRGYKHIEEYCEYKVDFHSDSHIFEEKEMQSVLGISKEEIAKYTGKSERERGILV